MTDAEKLLVRIAELQKPVAEPAGTPGYVSVTSSTMALLTIAYGERHPVVDEFRRQLGTIPVGARTATMGYAISLGFLKSLKEDIEAGLVGSIQKRTAGEVLASFVLLAKESLADTTDGSDNVGAVLVAAVYEDTLRRLHEIAGLEHESKLETVISELKKAEVLVGSTPSIAAGFLNFRNNALHARWALVTRPDIDGCLAFVESLLQRHFSD